MMDTSQTKRLLVLMAAVLAIALPFRPDSARSAEASTTELQRQIDHFVSSVVVSYMNGSLVRWDTPICPLVAGLPRDRGEFILTRVSQVAKGAQAPLAGEHCNPNFYVVVTDQPDALLKKWSRHDPTLLDKRNGMGYAKHALEARKPIRVWYNAQFRSADGAALSSNTSGLDLAGLSLGLTVSPAAAVNTLSSVVIVVDSNRTTDINIGQLSDYVAMIGLAEVHQDTDTGTAPSILQLFREVGQPPDSLTPWDQAFLSSLYNTHQTSVVQVSAIKTGMLEQMER
jgi:hypothetical protein